MNEDVAVKLMDLESAQLSLDEIVREAATMRAHSHPNVLPLLTSFVDAGARLWMVMPFVAGGSALNIMRFAFPDGLEEPVIATVMKEVLKGLCYVHASGAIHRDVKAGNILVGADGSVVLADFGVAATMERQGSWGSALASRSTFVGTPCWMAPEVMEQSAAGYSTLADIWSFGITLLELAHGHAPFAKYPPMKVLMMTIQNPPPTLDGGGGGGGGGGGRQQRKKTTRKKRRRRVANDFYALPLPPSPLQQQQQQQQGKKRSSSSERGQPAPPSPPPPPWRPPPPQLPPTLGTRDPLDLTDLLTCAILSECTYKSRDVGVRAATTRAVARLAAALPAEAAVSFFSLSFFLRLFTPPFFSSFSLLFFSFLL